MIKEIFDYLSVNLNELSSVLGIVGIFVAVSGLLNSMRGIYQVPVNHKIAVIGLPGVGKTTLITAIFEIVQRGDAIPGARLHGLRTIETVNKYVSRLSANLAIGPTTEQDIFLFRFSYKKKVLFWRKTYDVEIADFPGEYSEDISNQDVRNGDINKLAARRQNKQKSDKSEYDLASGLNFTLLNKEFFSWIASSSEYLFVIDLAAIYGSENPRQIIAEISGRIRTSWQIVEDAASERGIGRVRGREVHLIFTKVDSLVPLIHTDAGLSYMRLDVDFAESETDGAVQASEIRDQIRKVSEKYRMVRIDAKMIAGLDKVADVNNQNFSDLLKFFGSRTSFSAPIYTSVSLIDQRNRRMGIQKVVEAVLP